ncbi:peptidoglycan DD-metalloendopeptidase family protein [Snodgrassella communis]|uniref:peptidoglycan DD-metalloendopeptidase family protein n=2 Tax=Snodgrassella TaxID=1193515 RepID=UPI001EF598C7|nr:peptidoglycan DD-metalloendopeptidase family protein [Snodgrassella communis]
MSGSAHNGFYRVQRGDTLYRIGLRFNQNVNTLVRWNNLANANEIEVGQLIRVRKPASVSGRPTGVKPPSGRVARESEVVTTGTAAPDIRLQWPVRGTVISRFNGQTQKGIDIAGSRGTPVKAAAAGTVQYAGDELRGYGKLVLIKHSNSTMTAYAYNDSLKVRNGQSVQMGQTIATMGDSGTTGVKLHFEVRVNSRAVNPLRYLSD